MSSTGTLHPYRTGISTLRYALPFSLGVVIVLVAIDGLSQYVSTMDEHVFAVVVSITELSIGSMFVFFGVFGALAAVHRAGEER